MNTNLVGLTIAKNFWSFGNETIAWHLRSICLTTGKNHDAKKAY